MYLSFTVGNILQKFSKDKKNIVYYQQNNLFDHSLFELENNYYLFNSNQNNYEMPNVIDLPEKMTSLYNYNLSLTNNIIGHSTSSIQNFHINSIIFTHSYRPNFIKKEDASILNKNLERELKVFFSENSKISWGLNQRSEVIKYGIPKSFKVINRDRDKDILILNFNKTIHNQQLLAALRSKGYSCDSLDTCFMTTSDINEKLNEYNICIDLADHNVINMLCAISAGCKVATIKTEMLNNDYNDIPGLYLLESPSDILENISTIIKNDESIEKKSEIVSNIYSFDIFSNNIIRLINQINQEAFVK